MKNIKLTIRLEVKDKDFESLLEGFLHDIKGNEEEEWLVDGVEKSHIEIKADGLIKYSKTANKKITKN